MKGAISYRKSPDHASSLHTTGLFSAIYLTKSVRAECSGGNPSFAVYAARSRYSVLGTETETYLYVVLRLRLHSASRSFRRT
jgi:hypothetical protein